MTSLDEWRVAAAEASGGTSSDAIYESIERILERGNLRGRLLDYGAGIGNLTRRLSQLPRFQHIAGADIMARPAGLPDQIDWFHIDLNANALVHAGPFDVVVAAEVIEHLENPREVARECYRLLEPGGTLILTTPNNESLRSLLSMLMRGHFVAFLDSSYPAHITALVRQDLRRILLEAGFSKVDFTFTNRGGLPGHPVLSWQAVSFGLLKGLRFSDNILAVATK